MANKKIAIVSPNRPFASALPTSDTEGSAIYWFCEIEAAYSWSLKETPDLMIIDQTLFDTPLNCAEKYQKTIQQVCPNILMQVANFDASNLNEPPKAKINFFPKLDVLFKNGELKSVFQPIVEPHGDHIEMIGFECLSRICFNGEKYNPEFLFHYAQEKLKLINYDKVCLMQTLNYVPKNTGKLIFLNIRPQTVISKNFVPWFKEHLKTNNLAPEQIAIEITEHFCSVNEQELYNSCRSLQNLGFKIAIDDFGSGISNLSLLDILTPDFLKISGRFIKQSDQEKRKELIVKNILTLSADFKITAVVENVEKKSEWDLCQKWGAKLAQGFYFFKPMPKQDLLNLQ